MKGNVETILKRSCVVAGGVSALIFLAVLICGAVLLPSGGAAVAVLISGLTGLIFSVVFTVVTLRMYKARIITPVDEICTAAEKMAAGEYDISEIKNTGTEFDDISRAIFSTAENSRISAEIISDIAEGNFSRDVSGLSGNNAVTSGLKTLYCNMSKAFGEISVGAEMVNSDGERVSSASQSLSRGVSAQASTVEELSSTVNEIRDAVLKNAENARAAHNNAEEAAVAVKDGTEKMKELLKAMDDISNSTNEIATFIKAIEDIAFQTNILALNSSVEAARAGEAGKGFAVVASEVKNLATKSQDTAHRTSTVIQSCVQSVRDGVEKTRETASAFSVIAQKASDIGRGLNIISEECERQSEAITQINVGVEQISSVIRSTSETADECAVSAAALTGRSGDLREIVGRFRFGEVKESANISGSSAAKKMSGVKTPGAVKSANPAARNDTSADKRTPSFPEKRENGMGSRAVQRPAPKPAEDAGYRPAAKPAGDTGYRPAPKPAADKPKSAPVSTPKKYTSVHTSSGMNPEGNYATAQFIDVPDSKY